MGRINKTVPSRGPVAPLQTVSAPRRVATHEGGAGFLSDTKSEAFRLGVNLFGGNENKFYETGKNRDSRFAKLIEQLAITDPTWTVQFLVWLRTKGNIRTASIIGAAHFVHARLNHKASVADDELLSSLGQTGLNRYLVGNICNRADEPGEFAAYWLAAFGALPKAVKRGLSDAANRLYTEYSVQKWDTESKGLRFADVLALTHARPQYTPPSFAWTEDDVEVTSMIDKRELFKHIIDRRYGNPGLTELPMVSANKQLRKDAQKDVTVLLDQARVKAAGMTWEDVLSLGGSKLDKAKLWESADMGYMAKIRNLRNFEEAGTSTEFRDAVIQHLTAPKAVANSKQLPFRFLAAYQEVNSLQYKAALETALNLSTQNIPDLDGENLVLVDVSGSMHSHMSGHSKMMMVQAASVFGAALAAKNPKNVTLVAFGTGSEEIPFKAGESVLPLSERIVQSAYRIGGGTNTGYAIQRHYQSGKHKRVIIITDEQSHYNGYRSIGELVPENVFMYSMDLGGYNKTSMETKRRRVQLAGLTDATFRFIDLYERGESGRWPWEESSR